MPSHRKSTPSYARHFANSKAQAVWYDADGVRQQKLLPGLYNSQKSLDAFARLQVGLRNPLGATGNIDGVGFAELLVASLEMGRWEGENAAVSSEK